METLTAFNYRDETISVQHVESTQVTDGVVCDVYSFPESPDRDLGIITIQPGCSTPLQRVVQGDETIEGHISGEGQLTITHLDGTKTILQLMPESYGFCQEVKVGETMQWHTTGKEPLVVFEVCYPPYQEGRFENITN